MDKFKKHWLLWVLGLVGLYFVVQFVEYSKAVANGTGSDLTFWQWYSGSIS